MFRRHCMGPGKVSFQVVNDSAITAPSGCTRVNYRDPNYNVSLPVFSIHGNHDDPSTDSGGTDVRVAAWQWQQQRWMGDSHAAALLLLCRQSIATIDVLSGANLLNYFGKADHVRPACAHLLLSRLTLVGCGLPGRQRGRATHPHHQGNSPGARTLAVCMIVVCEAAPSPVSP